MKNNSSTKTPIAFQGGMAGSFGINAPMQFLNASDNNLSESFSDHNNPKSQEPISFLSSDRKEVSALQNRPSIETMNPENFEIRGSVVPKSQSRTDVGPVSDYSARNSAKSAHNRDRDHDSTQYYTGGGTEAKGLSKVFASLSKDLSEENPRKATRNKEVQKSCVITSFLPAQIEFDAIKLSPDKRRRAANKSNVSARDIPSQSEIDSDLISRLDTERFCPTVRRTSPGKDAYTPRKSVETHHHVRSNKSGTPSMQNVNDSDYLLNQTTNPNHHHNHHKGMEGVPSFKGGQKEEKIKNGKLAGKLEDMEGLLQQMKMFHERLYQNYVETKDEVQKESVEKTNIINNLTQDSSQNEKLKLKISELQKMMKTLSEENHHLKDSNQKKTDVIGKLEDQIKAAKSEVAILKEKHEAKVESLMAKIKKLEKENLDPTHVRDKSKEMNYRRDLRINTEDIMDSREEFRPSLKEREMTETSQDSKKILKERLNYGNNEELLQAQKDLRRYKEEIESLRRENKKLRGDAGGHGRKSADLRNTVQPFDNLLDNTDTQGIEKKRLPDANMMYKVLTDISIEVEVENIGGIYPKVKEIQDENRTNKKFVNTFLDLVYKCSPSGSFEKKPNLKQGWKWMKRLMEEYMEMRKEGKDYLPREDGLMKEIVAYLGVKSKEDILEKIKELMSENGLMSQVISKLKAVYSIELSVPLGELDKRLELAMMNNGRVVNKPESRYANLPLKMDNR